jgi:hypothetical protein
VGRTLANNPNFLRISNNHSGLTFADGSLSYFGCPIAQMVQHLQPYIFVRFVRMGTPTASIAQAPVNAGVNLFRD